MMLVRVMLLNHYVFTTFFFFLPKNGNLIVWDHHVVCIYAIGALHLSIRTG